MNNIGNWTSRGDFFKSGQTLIWGGRVVEKPLILADVFCERLLNENLLKCILPPNLYHLKYEKSVEDCNQLGKM